MFLRLLYFEIFELFLRETKMRQKLKWRCQSYERLALQYRDYIHLEDDFLRSQVAPWVFSEIFSVTAICTCLTYIFTIFDLCIMYRGHVEFWGVRTFQTIFCWKVWYAARFCTESSDNCMLPSIYEIWLPCRSSSSVFSLPSTPLHGELEAT